MKKSSKKKDNQTVKFNLRLIFIGIVATLLFLVVAGHLIIIQFVDGKKWSEKAYNQQVRTQILSPNRGTIYDANGAILAQSIPVDTVSLNPGKVNYKNKKEVPKEVIAEGISSIFEITYDEMMEKLNSNKTVIVIEKKVEKDKIDKLEKWLSDNDIVSGINIDADSKRYYPNNDLASNLIGFCGTDNNGQTGLEERYDDILTGTAGKIVTTVDATKKAISDEDEQYVASENGRNIYLTIDANIQSIAERYLEQAVEKNSSSTGGNVVIMNPQNGEILAMATYPDYNLNQPFDFSRTGFSEEEWNALESADRSTNLQNLWKNKAVSGTYEPGSTFKLITAAAALEEGFVETDTEKEFFCSGSYQVADQEISCWRADNPHGAQSLREALCNSCNPAFMQLGQRVTAKNLYKYYQAFGLFDSVGNDIARAYPGTFYKLEQIGPVELATMSFGQRFEISPLQLITAVSAICNDGVLVKPKIIKEIENTDTESKEKVETKEIRQVVSKDTTDKIKDMMRSVVTDGTGWRASVEGFAIGGKSGTSEPPVGREDEGYVASFIAISPIENTQIVTLVALYGLSEGANHQGGQVAGPVTAQILSEVLPYLGVASNTTMAPTEQRNLISVPNVTGMTAAQATTHLQELGFNVTSHIDGNPDEVIIKEQVPKYGNALIENSTIQLYQNENQEKTMVEVPNIEEMGIGQAIATLKARNLNINIDGSSGIVVSQDPSFGTQVEEGTIINVVVKEQLSNSQ